MAATAQQRPAVMRTFRPVMLMRNRGTLTLTTNSGLPLPYYFRRIGPAIRQFADGSLEGTARRPCVDSVHELLRFRAIENKALRGATRRTSVGLRTRRVERDTWLGCRRPVHASLRDSLLARFQASSRQSSEARRSSAVTSPMATSRPDEVARVTSSTLPSAAFFPTVMR